MSTDVTFELAVNQAVDVDEVLKLVTVSLAVRDTELEKLLIYHVTGASQRRGVPDQGLPRRKAGRAAAERAGDT